MRAVRASVTVLAIIIGCSVPTYASPILFQASGSNPSDIQAAVDAFRGALGTLNPNVAGSFSTGRREINWDGVPNSFAAPNNLPANFFNANSPRGVTFSTPGTGFQVSANAGIDAIEFGNIDPSYPGLFSAFSAQRLFTPLGSNITDVLFFVPGSSTPASTSAFGVVFTDVDLANTTSLQFFDLLDNPLGTFFVPAASGDQTFSFLGVRFVAGEQVGRVRLTAGNQTLAPGSITGDVVAMDDFIYAEPQAVPEPATATLLLLGFGLTRAVRSRRRR